MNEERTRPAANDQTIASPQPGSHQPEALQKKRAGERIYDLKGEVARGGMGAVLSAQDPHIERTVALKVMLAGLAQDPDRAARFTQEAKLTGQLEHPNIVPVYDLSVDEAGQPFYTMKYVKGVTLHAIFGKLKAGDAATVAQYPLSQLLTIFQKVCDAIAYAHSKRVVHRDLKPANVMVGKYGEVLVMDWGLAKVLDQPEVTPASPQSLILTVESVELTAAGTVLGSPQYMAPEQAAGKLDEIDDRTDIFALGGMLYHLLTLHPPVGEDSVKEMLRKIRAGEILPASSYNPKTGKRTGTIQVGEKTFPYPPLIPLRHCPGGKIPDSLSAVAMKALALRREDRYPTVTDLQKDVAAYQGGFATRAEQAGAWRQMALLVKRHKEGFALAAVALVVLVATVTGFLVRVTREKTRAETERSRAEANEQQARAERERAENALTSLRETAPTFREQALAELKEHRLAEALKSVQHAIDLQPAVAEYHRLKGNILQVWLRLAEAETAYRAALAIDGRYNLAQENLALCERLRKELAGQAELPRPRLVELRAAMVRQGRLSEANVLLAKLGKDLPANEAACRAAVGKNNVQVPNGDTIEVIVPPTVATFSMLRGLQIDSLVLSGCKVTDLSPLRGMALTRFRYDGAPVCDLSPLGGMPLEYFDIRNCAISDLSPLRGMPLRELWIYKSQVTDLTPLKGMALTNLVATGTKIHDLSPLRGMPLKSLDITSCALVSDLSPLEGMPLDRLRFADTMVTDIRPLRGMPLRHLMTGRISDLALLKGMPLEELYTGLPGTIDLTPLRGMPLRRLHLSWNRDVASNSVDVTPLADCRQLEELIITLAVCRNFEALHSLPNLRVIGEQNPLRPLPATEFWKKYDAQKTNAPASKPTRPSN